MLNFAHDSIQEMIAQLLGSRRRHYSTHHICIALILPDVEPLCLVTPPAAASVYNVFCTPINLASQQTQPAQHILLGTHASRACAVIQLIVPHEVVLRKYFRKICRKCFHTPVEMGKSQVESHKSPFEFQTTLYNKRELNHKLFNFDTVEKIHCSEEVQCRLGSNI